MMELKELREIGFYTLSSQRALSSHAKLERCELIVTSACNFHCPYCRGVGHYSRNCGGHLAREQALQTLNLWTEQNLTNIRFSGGEPLLYPHLFELVDFSRTHGIQRIAISSNGSFPLTRYKELLAAGVNDFSISLDACCAQIADQMAGRSSNFDQIVTNIAFLSSQTYVTVGVVLTPETVATVPAVVQYAHDLGVADIRLITAAQFNGDLPYLEKIPTSLLEAHPILKYRVTNLLAGRNVRGIPADAYPRCALVRDDMVVAGRWHFPCVIYLREGGEPIGEIGDRMRSEREEWGRQHNTFQDPICQQNCLDCLVDYNQIANSAGSDFPEENYQKI